MLNLINRLKTKAVSNLKGIVFEGVLATVFLGVCVLLLTGNIIRVFTNGTSNYNTFMQEKEDLDKLQAKNQQLQDDYNYVTSDEYKQLLLRDSQRLGTSGENLFQTEDKPTYFSQTPQYLDLKTKKTFGDWWISLIH